MRLVTKSSALVQLELLNMTIVLQIIILPEINNVLTRG